MLLHKTHNKYAPVSRTKGVFDAHSRRHEWNSGYRFLGEKQEEHQRRHFLARTYRSNDCTHTGGISYFCADPTGFPSAGVGSPTQTPRDFSGNDPSRGLSPESAPERQEPEFEPLLCLQHSKMQTVILKKGNTPTATKKLQ